MKLLKRLLVAGALLIGDKALAQDGNPCKDWTPKEHRFLHDTSSQHPVYIRTTDSSSTVGWHEPLNHYSIRKQQIMMKSDPADESIFPEMSEVTLYTCIDKGCHAYQLPDQTAKDYGEDSVQLYQASNGMFIRITPPSEELLEGYEGHIPYEAYILSLMNQNEQIVFNDARTSFEKIFPLAVKAVQPE